MSINTVIIIPDDNLMIIDGRMEQFSFTVFDEDVQAIHYNNGIGTIEYKKSKAIAFDSYDVIAPYVNQFNQYIQSNVYIETANQLSWEQVKQTRNMLLQQSDWTQLSDCPLSKAQKDKWNKYRKELRDITSNYKRPEDVTFPETP
jgi:hypothetical protein